MKQIFNLFNNTVNLFFNLCIFKKGPQDVPYSGILLFGLLIINYVFHVSFINLPIPFEIINLISFVSLLTQWLFVYLTLFALNLKSRFNQTMSAILGTSLIVDLLTILFFLIFKVYIVYLIFVVWHLMILKNIFEKGFEISNTKAAVLAIMMFILRQIFATIIAMPYLKDFIPA
jgi:hypothetical protein